MRWEVTIPQWRDGCSLIVEHIEAGDGGGATEKAAKILGVVWGNVPMTPRICRCNVCSDVQFQSLLARTES